MLWKDAPLSDFKAHELLQLKNTETGVSAAKIVWQVIGYTPHWKPKDIDVSQTLHRIEQEAKIEHDRVTQWDREWTGHWSSLTSLWLPMKFILRIDQTTPFTLYRDNNTVCSLILNSLRKPTRLLAFVWFHNEALKRICLNIERCDHFDEAGSGSHNHLSFSLFLTGECLWIIKELNKKQNKCKEVQAV